MDRVQETELSGSSALLATRGLSRLSGIGVLLPEIDSFRTLGRWAAPDAEVVIGWGRRPTAERARRIAQHRNLPFLSLEDGFLRSWGLACHGYQTQSIVVDWRGIYYDARQPSDLETLILQGECSTEMCVRASRAIDLIRTHRLSKYNHGSDRPLQASGCRRILVVDQTRGDASIAGAKADADTFHQMLDEAIDQHPDAEILVKTHPDVLAGKRQGFLTDEAQRRGCTVMAENRHPWALLDAVDTVYVVGSQLGFEALLAGKHVVCHGMPFYAGWGLTDDRQREPRRNVRRTLETVFAAAYIDYCRYYNPFTNERVSLEDTITLLADQKRQQAATAGNWAAVGLSWWKRRFVPDFLGDRAHVRHLKTRGEARSEERVVMWSTAHPGGPTSGEGDDHANLWRGEDGFLRSVGLGANLVAPLSLIFDSRGMYYDPRSPSDLEVLLNETEFDDTLINRAQSLRKRLTQQRISKYNLGSSAALPQLPADRKLILVPGQVETDASIRYGAPEIKTNAQLLKKVRTDNPAACILYKPHPDVVAGARAGERYPKTGELFDFNVVDIEITQLIDHVDEVHTMTSLTGFEALMRDVPVITYGCPFYAGWGLTRDHLHCTRRQRALTVDELVAGALILYPRYLDPVSRKIINAETAARLLELMRQQKHAPSLRTRYIQLYRATLGRPA